MRPADSVVLLCLYPSPPFPRPTEAQRRERRVRLPKTYYIPNRTAAGRTRPRTRGGSPLYYFIAELLRQVRTNERPKKIIEIFFAGPRGRSRRQSRRYPR